MQKRRRHADGNLLRMLAQRRITNRAFDAGDLPGCVTKPCQPRPEPRPFGGRPDQTRSGKAVGQQTVAQIKVKRVGIGQDQMLGVGRGKRHSISGIWHWQGTDVSRNGARKTVRCRINPSDRQIRQGGQSAHHRAANVPGTPDPKLAFRAGDGFDEPALQQLRRWHRAAVAGARQQTFHRKRHIAAIDRAGDHIGGQPCSRLCIINFAQQRDRPTAALTKGGAKKHTGQPGAAAPRKHCAGIAGGLPFQRTTADGAGLPRGPDQHRSPGFAGG